MADWKSGYADMEMSDDDKLDYMSPIPMKAPDYPCGLRICLTHTELDKLSLSHDCEIGDMLEFRAIACVTSISKSDGMCRVELQIQGMQCEEE